jgi:tetraacyldisaccharide 4'-kinase
LRESADGKERANMVIVTKCPENMSPMQYRIVAEALKLRPYQRLFFSSFKYGRMVNLATHEIRSRHEMSKNHVLLLTGIGCPRQMEMDMNSSFASVECMDFHDHHYYDKNDLQNALNRLKALPHPHIIVTTEKDATKLMDICELYEEITKHIWVLPIRTKILQEKERLFNEKITGYVQKNLRNR